MHRHSHAYEKPIELCEQGGPELMVFCMALNVSPPPTEVDRGDTYRTRAAARIEHDVAGTLLFVAESSAVFLISWTRGAPLRAMT